MPRRAKESHDAPKPKRVFSRRTKHQEPQIDQAEIERLRRLVIEEEMQERDMRREMREIIRGRDKQLNKELRRIEEHNRRLVMWIGVIVLMIIILVFWLANLRAMITVRYSEGPQPQMFDVESIRGNFSRTMKDVIKDIDTIKAEANKVSSTTTSTPSGTKPFPSLPSN